MTNMFLHVNITVPRTNEESVLDQLQVVLAEKPSARWRLEGGIPPAVTGGHHPVRGRARSFASQTTCNSSNVWRLPMTSARPMSRRRWWQLAETASYVKLDSLVHIEQQEIVFRINKPTADTALFDLKQVPATAGGTFVRIRHYPSATTSARSSSPTARSRPGGSPPRNGSSWVLSRTFTGLLNEFWDFWYVPSQPDLKTLEQHLVDLVTPGHRGGRRRSTGFADE